MGLQEIVFGLLALISLTSAVTTTNGTGGIPCGPHGHCLESKSTCDAVTNECICNNPPYLEQIKDGQLDCYKQNTRWGRGVNDPTYTVFDLDPKHSYKYLLPCRVLFSHTYLKLKIPGEGNSGYCECKTYSWNKKHFGKIYARGVELTCDITKDTAPTTSLAFTSRVEGWAQDGTYHFTEWGSNTFMDANPTKDYHVNINTHGIVYQSQYDEEQNRVILNMKACGHRLTFTPYDYDSTGNTYDYLAGFSVAINCAHGPNFLSPDDVMSTGPSDNGGPPITSAVIDGLDIMTSFQYRALLSMIPQTQEDPNPKCAAGKTAVSLCTTPEKRNLTMEMCNFIFQHPHFIRCVDSTNNGEVIQDLYNQCVTAICDDGVSCAGFVTNLQTASAGCPAQSTTDILEYSNWDDGTWTC